MISDKSITPWCYLTEYYIIFNYIIFYYIHLYSTVSYRILSEHATLFDHILITMV